MDALPRQRHSSSGSQRCCCAVLCHLQVSWEETSAAAMTHLLRCSLMPPAQVLDSAAFIVPLCCVQVSWEETTEAAMTHLLRSALARSAKDAAAAVPPLAPAADTARLKKHISLVLERLSKGMRLVAGSSSNNGGSAAAVAAH